MTVFEVAAVASPIVSMVFALFAFRRGQKGDDTSTAREMGTILTEIGYIKSQMDSLARKLDSHDERYMGLSERVSATEQAVKSAHKRIDDIAGERGGRHE
jgi:septal ring factor EnvC (AmiA/AmiB activator)